jgi:quinol-cytochrome oxidoreductase complex cytochrome b subunit
MVRGHLGTAIHNNALLPVALISWVIVSILDRNVDTKNRKRWLIVALAIVVIAFVYFRNMPGSRLAPVGISDSNSPRNKNSN